MIIGYLMIAIGLIPVGYSVRWMWQKDRGMLRAIGISLIAVLSLYLIVGGIALVIS